MNRMTALLFYVNGLKVEEPLPDPRVTLLQFLRKKLCLTGTKEGCNQGGCGSCTVILSWKSEEGQIQHSAVNACLVPLCFVHGYAVTTVEGVGNTRIGLHDIQKRLVESHGIQCGYCTPGMIMSVFGLLQNQSSPSQKQLEKSLEGNLCRCTGYRPIVEAFKPLCSQKCNAECRSEKDIEDILKGEAGEQETNSYHIPEYKIIKGLKPIESIEFTFGELRWIRPVAIEEVLKILLNVPSAQIVMGATSIAKHLKKLGLKKGTFVCCNNVKELQKADIKDGELCIGSAVTITQLRNTLENLTTKALTDGCNKVVSVLLNCIQSLACEQIRNISTVGGNLFTPFSDLPTVLMALDAKVTFLSKAGHQEFTVDNCFFAEQKQTKSSTGSLLTSVTVPLHLNDENFTVRFYKQQNKQGFDFAKVNACFAVMADEQEAIQSLNLCFGSLFSTYWSARETSTKIIGRKINAESLDIVSKSLIYEVKKTGKVGRYKLTLVCNLLKKFWTDVAEKKDQHAETVFVPSSSTRIYEDPNPDQPCHDCVGKPVPLITAPSLVCGEAMFLDDTPSYANELYLALVLSTKAHANILSVSRDKALTVPGVVEYIDQNSVPGVNKWGRMEKDEPVFAEKEVTCFGQVIGAIVAENETIARHAASLVDVEYEELPAILSINEAIEAGSFFDDTSRSITRGDPDGMFEKCDFVLEGCTSSGLQEHFYMETNTTIAIPKNESNEVEIYSTTQGPKFLQSEIADVLGIQRNRVIVRQKRIGGGFGGREYRLAIVALPTAIAASRYGRPVRCRLSRKEDIKITGKRHEILTKYKIGFTKTGVLKAVKINAYLNGGHTKDVTPAVASVFMMNADACYHVPHFHVESHCCRTNLPSNTALRGFGAPEAVYVMENIISEVAMSLGLSSKKVRELNMYQNGDKTHYKNVIENCNLQRCWQECIQKSDYEARRLVVEDFNRTHRKKKRGLVMQPMKMLIGYTNQFENQSGALVHVYLDGSVLLAHGGVEMGQGLHTKMIQVASRALGVPMDKIHTIETGTNTVPNTPSTAASVSSDLNGAAVVDACKTILKRIEKYKIAKPESTWNDWIQCAYFDRISLSATGIGRPGNTHWDEIKGEGCPFLYWSYGSGCTEVEIDCLTGQHQVLRQDIVMDVGKSLNPSIDIGQIEGAFIQGYGWVTMEEVKISPDGEIMAEGPIDYKIPGVNNIPRQFNISLLKDCPNEKAVYSSKGIGEPSLILSIGVFLALKEAIIAARDDAGLQEEVQLDIPLTAEKICNACNA